RARPLLEIMRGNGQKTRDEAFAGLSSETQQHLLQTLSLIKSSLLAACTQPAVDREKVHG
ncbi:MarR family transcriptional regulator, partial [Mesorhizobium sp. M1C.F.Ca.ET.187.01.1.1]